MAVEIEPNDAEMLRERGHDRLVERGRSAETVNAHSFGLASYGMDGFIPATAQDLKELVLRCGASEFPPLFVEVATSLGNIAFDADVAITGLSGEDFGIQAFHGGGSPSDASLLFAHEMFVENSGFPSYWVHFARNLGGWTYVFDSRDVLGPVCIDIGEPAVIPVSNSFDEFILSLHIG